MISYNFGDVWSGGKIIGISERTTPFMGLSYPSGLIFPHD
jgi:hypothetical protein